MGEGTYTLPPSLPLDRAAVASNPSGNSPGKRCSPPPPTPHPLVLPLLFRSPLRGLILQIETSQFWVRVEVRSQAQGIWNHSPCVPTFLPCRGEV